ncbi:MAG: prolyl aminopeptidase [Alphaproteobacteria bacterium]|nr:prolyl aminopeptidase [Alphaproteobacteria bacterium]
MRTTPLIPLFPEITPYSTGFLAVGAPHQIYWEQSGNPYGVPVVLLHGGPGAGATPKHRRFFDPDHYRIVIFDQRGAGRSTPLGDVTDNSPAHLVADMEALRERLGIERWHVFGGSWGSTLALAYATAYPDRCLSLILRGIFLFEKPEIDWFLTDMGAIFPEAWDQFRAHIPEEEANDLLTAYHRRLFSDDPATRLNAALHWALYEGACSALFPNYETISTDEQRQRAVALARIEAHYFLHHAFAPENSLLKKLDRIRSIPATIVQGRYDVICPMRTAYRLHALWPEADFVVVPDAGHSALDPPLRSRLIEATENLKTIA